jgi:hypothetical protein
MNRSISLISVAEATASFLAAVPGLPVAPSVSADVGAAVSSAQTWTQ